MYPGRSAWTRGILALGVGALFLFGWRIETAGDALSTSTSSHVTKPPIDSDRNYFSVVVASSRSASQLDEHGKKEERSRTEGQDRQASRGDYSASDQETRSPSDVHRNAEPDGEHGASYSPESSLPLWNLERMDDESRSDGGSKSYFVDHESFATWNFEENDDPSRSYLAEGVDLKRKRGLKNYLANKASSARSLQNDPAESISYSPYNSLPLWSFEKIDGSKGEHSRSIRISNIKENDELNNHLVDKLSLSWNIQNNYNTKGEDDQRRSISYSMERSLPSSSHGGKSLFAFSSDSKDHTKHASNGGTNSHSDDKLLPWRNLEKNTKDDDDHVSAHYSVENFPRSWSHEENDHTENEYNHGSISDLAKSWLSPWNPVENDNTADEGDPESMNYLTEKSFPSSNQKNDRKNDNPELTSRSLDDLFLSSNPKKIDPSENNRELTRKLIKEKNDFMEEPKWRSYDNEGNYTMVKGRIKEAEATDIQDESWFSKDDEGTSGGALNGSPAGERSDVKENLSRELNGQSMNEPGKSFSRSYYFDVGNSFSLTLHDEHGENDDEIGERTKSTTGFFKSYLHTVKSNNVDYKNSEHDNEEETSWYNSSSTSDSINEKRRRSYERNINVEFPNEIADDFHNSDRSYGLARPDWEEGYKRGEESISGSVDSPRATRRRLAGMQEDRVVFFRGARSSAKTSELFRSRKGRAAEQDRGKILERGTSETRSRDRLPGATDPSVDFREIDAARWTFDEYEITDRGNRPNANIPQDFTSTSLRGYNELSNKNTAKIVARKSKRKLKYDFASDVQNSKELNLFELNMRNRKLTDLTSTSLRNKETSEGWGRIGKFANKLILTKKKPSNLIVTQDFRANEESKLKNVQKFGIELKVGSKTEEEEDFKESFANVGQFDLEESSFDRKTGLHREKGIGVRRKRYTNYYSPQSVTPMAYVHIQPSYPVPVASAPNRKCVRCMVVYKPCPSAHKPMHNNVLPPHKYQELVSTWQGLKYGCRCNLIGSISTTCDIVTGQCQCKPHITGRQCDQCTIGFWGITTGAGCAPCGCDPIGSYNSSCHDSTGQCYCKPGVVGSRCDNCLPGYYGFSSNGCQACDPCVRSGHICDPDTGRCVCPALTFGEHCDRCRPGSWDLVPGVGCRPCACTLGSTKSQCDYQGQCPCRIGYAGLKCERCAKGYYGYPRCRPCSCSVAGTLPCDEEICDCNDQGQCPCKEHAIGRQCNQCKEGTFGLAVDNPKGCTECFCFGRTTSCQQAGLSWGQRRLARPRTLYINDTSNDIVVSKFRSQIFLSPINGGLNVTNGLSTIPDIEGDVTIPSNLYYNYPLYWKLPESFLGDKVVSYGGFLRFTTVTEGGIPLRSTFQYPIVQLQGNSKIVLEYYLPTLMSNNHYEVRLHESLWQLQNRPDYRVTREVLMVALQNLQYILVKASDSAEFTKATLLEASLDAAVLTPTHTPPFATGVEICECPPEYNNTSCQDPSIGYYRWYKNTTVTSPIVIDLIGEARRCQCNGRSKICDIETGHCLNCRGNTTGPRCDICADSFYGHPDFGCKPCPCPQVDKRFSNTCMVLADAEPICICKPGYTGRKCEQCSSGYYGFPHLPDGKCMPCNCNPAGSWNDECDAETGQCRCRAGSTGRDCSECTAYRHVYINNVCTSCNDNCTGILLDTVAVLSQELAKGTTHIANGYIPPPWEDLSYIDSNVTAFFEDIHLQNTLKQRMKNIPWHDHRKLLNNVEILLKTANEQAKRADTFKLKTSDLKNNMFSAKIELDNIRKYIEDTIFFLNQYSNDSKKVEIKKALKMAKMILNSLKAVNLTKKTMEIEDFLEDVAEYTNWLNSLYDATEPLAIAQLKTEEYSEKLADMRNQIEYTMETLFTYDGLYNTMNQTLLEARNHCNEINMLHSKSNASVTEGEKLANETRGFIVDFQNNVQDLPELRNKLTYWFDKLNMKEELLFRLNYEYNDTYVIPAVAHVKNLSNYVDQYISLFSETRNIAASPLKASQAYKNIVDSIRTANITAMAAKDIVEETYNKIFPNGPNSKSLLDNAKEISLASSKQRDSAKKHGKLVQDASVGLELQKEAVNTLKNTLNATGIKNNEINVKLQNLQNNSKKLRENIYTILNKNEKVLEDVKSTQKLIDDYKEGIAERLKPKLFELKREGDSKISLANEKLSEALSNIKKADAKLISLSNAAVKRKNAFDKWNDTFATKLQKLKDKIAEARNTADGIRISLMSADEKKCIRSYRPSTLQPTSTNTIVMTFVLPKGKKEGSLFYLPSSVNDDFLALEIFDRKVRFIWNVGGGTGILTHPEEIKSGSFKEDRFWYRIEAERVHHLGRLYVRKQSSPTAGYPVMNATNSEYGRFDITTSDRVWIGGIPSFQRKRSELIAPNGLPGCVHQVILDGKPIGLWNFITTAAEMACKACMEGVQDATDEVTYSFNGEGYAVRNRVFSGPYNKYSFGVSISFRTYDENALLFLAINPENYQHIMIFLREGKVILHIGYGGNVSMEMSSKFKHNTGNWTKVDAFRYYQSRKNIEKCSLTIGGEADKKIGAPTPQPKKEDIPDFLQAKYYIGGVPPSFRAEKIMLPSQVSFLGCMSNIIVEEGYDPMAEQYYGVEPTCGHKPLKIVGFYGDGYLQHAAYTLHKRSSTVSLSFRTMQKEAVLLLSTFEGQEERVTNIRHANEESNRENYYSACIINGQVQVRMNAGKGELILQSNETFNDGRYHSITIIKKRKDVELRIDDAYQTAGRLPTSAAIKAPEGNGGLFFGGLPILINNTKMIATITPLYGAIRDVIFDDQIIRFDEIVSFEHALIGRPGPSMGKDPPTYTPSASLSRGLSTQPEGCQKVPYYSLEAGALKFGDKPNSHTQLYLNFKKFWEKKYAIEFDFRTYYPNGLLFITPGLRPKHYLMVVIRDGQLLLLVKSKVKKEILFKTPFNDGNWHHVVISHDERKLTLLVNSQTPRTIKVPRKIGLASMMYIGGLPESGTLIPEQVVVKLETLKGCIRGLRINGNVYDMVGSTSRAYQVGQCFPNVESGAYFQDEAYAIYKRNFELGAVLELQLEFRTSELSGVLLSITAPGNSPSLSLELNNGKVIMSGDLGDNNPLYVEQRFTSPYTICDNQWHRIQAVYNDEELALKVDEMDQKYGLPANVNYHIMDSTVSGPLYIGGLPASAPKGTLITRDHFNGCIRNVMIGGERRDWTDMDELHNIHLSSCPVQ
ncbi:Laminin subunit alpha-1 [Anthophora quadrimaculata]